MDLCPAVQCEKDLAGFRTAVEDGDVVELRSVLNLNLRMILLQITSDGVVGVGIPSFDHHQSFAVQIFYLNAGTTRERMLLGHGDHLFISARGSILQRSSQSLESHTPIKKSNFSPNCEISERIPS
mgnify:CR=1 FL=1